MSVYFVLAGGYVKIGYSADPFRRSATVTTHGKRPADLPYGTEAELLGWIPGDKLVEMCWHARFVGDHVAGEWFYLDPAMVLDLIWEDPCGVDLRRMSAAAVFTADKNPGVSREQIAQAGIPVEGVTIAEALESMNARMVAAFVGGAA